MSSAAGSSPVHLPNHSPSLVQRGCLGVGAATVVGALGYSGLYALGHCRHLASRVVKYSIAGSLVGLVGLGLRKTSTPSQRNPVPGVGARMPTQPASSSTQLSPLERLRKEAAEDVEGLLGEPLGEQRTAHAVARRLEQTPDIDNHEQFRVFGAYLRYHVLSATERVNQTFGKRTVHVDRIIVSTRELAPPSDGEKPSGLLIKALVHELNVYARACRPSKPNRDATWKQSPVGLVLEIRHDLDPIRDIIRKLCAVQHLVAIECAHVGNEETCEVLQDLVDHCPRLVEVPHTSRRHAEKLIAEYGSQYDAELDFCDFIDDVRNERIPRL